jgi:GNAT superfamily N-acetyltransferase
MTLKIITPLNEQSPNNLTRIAYQLYQNRAKGDDCSHLRARNLGDFMPDPTRLIEHDGNIIGVARILPLPTRDDRKRMDKLTAEYGAQTATYLNKVIETQPGQGVIHAVTDLVILPDERGKGYGSRAMALLAEQADALGQTPSLTLVYNGNAAAHHTVRNAGYTAISAANHIANMQYGPMGIRPDSCGNTRDVVAIHAHHKRNSAPAAR